MFKNSQQRPARCCGFSNEFDGSFEKRAFEPGTPQINGECGLRLAAPSRGAGGSRAAGAGTLRASTASPPSHGSLTKKPTDPGVMRSLLLFLATRSKRDAITMRKGSAKNLAESLSQRCESLTGSPTPGVGFSLPPAARRHSVNPVSQKCHLCHRHSHPRASQPSAPPPPLSTAVPASRFVDANEVFLQLNKLPANILHIQLTEGC